VIESPAGFHIIQVIDKRGAGIKPLEEVREEIKNEIGKEKMSRKAQDWIEDLRKRSFLEIKMD
jgi:parvulin-like peptidyl-prolyl isomerase